MCQRPNGVRMGNSFDSNCTFIRSKCSLTPGNKSHHLLVMNWVMNLVRIEMVPLVQQCVSKTRCMRLVRVDLAPSCLCCWSLNWLTPRCVSFPWDVSAAGNTGGGCQCSPGLTGFSSGMTLLCFSKASLPPCQWHSALMHSLHKESKQWSLNLSVLLMHKGINIPISV